MTVLAEAEQALRAFGAGRGDVDIGEAALALAAFDRPRVGLDRYRTHLTALADGVAARIGAAGVRDAALESRAAALAATIAGEHGYRGDTLTYDDIQNANLMRVVDRRRGLPVALGILYIATARRVGWTATGLAFPGHFLIRLDRGPERAILDPFDGGAMRDTADLRTLLKSVAGPDAELGPAHYAACPDRDVLLRLENNIKLRLLRAGRHEEALAVLRRMLWLAPDLPELLREAAGVAVHLGNFRTAIDMMEACLAAATDPRARHHAATMLQELRGRLN